MTIARSETSTPKPILSGLARYRVDRPTGEVRLKLDANEGRVPAIDLSSIDADKFRRYPDASKLEQQIAGKFGLAAEQVVVTAGGDEAIDRICRSYLKSGSNIIFPTPSFEMIRKYSLMADAEVREVPWSDQFPVEAIIKAADEATAMVAVVSPNNPTGATVTNAELTRLADALPPHCLFLVDQAYAEFEDDTAAEVSLTQFALDCVPNAVVIRTLSKAWGLAGLRVGYALGRSELLEGLRCVGGPFPVSAVSIAIAEHVLGMPEAANADYLTQIRRERSQLVSMLTEYGVTTRQSQGNFVWVTFDGSRCSQAFVFQALLAQGILVRRFENAGLRITCPGDEEDFAFLSRVLKSIFAPEAILFDMDGVLVDEAASYRESIRLTCESFGVSITGEEIAELKLCGDANNDWIFTQRLLDQRGHSLSLEVVKDRFEEIYQGTADDAGMWQREARLVDADWLSQLATRYPLAIVTGRPRGDAIRFLENHELKDCFGAIVCMEDGPAKPDPSNVVTAMKHLSVESAWMIGDTPDDAKAAIGAGVVAIGIVAPGDEPKFAIEKLTTAGVTKIVDSLEQFGDLIP